MSEDEDDEDLLEEEEGDDEDNLYKFYEEQAKAGKRYDSSAESNL